MTISPKILDLMIRELGAHHPAVAKLMKNRQLELIDELQRRMGIHPTLIRLRRVSRAYELDEAPLRDRVSALQACEELGISSDAILKSLQQGRRDAQVARVVRRM